MNFTQYDLGYQSAGTIVRVDLEGTEANVRLLDDANFAKFKRGADHRYVGGHYKSSPVLLETPTGGQWHVVVDLGGFAGQVRSSVEVLA